ncbi:MAG: class I SAM-dependent methyltransferase [Cytophagales bacterium]|nr:class I SAM-dependent methyltransferase [Cytophaga sp.]
MGLSKSVQFSTNDIARYYDVSEDHYVFFWDLNQSHALHYGYWDTNTKSFREALANINKLMADTAGITEGMKVLDAGCGVGGSTMWLAAHKSASVKGITLSHKQAKRGNENIALNSLSDKAKLEVQDFTQTSYPSASFDVVWAIESVCHADDKNAFLKEAYRLLKPGGKLILADFFIERDANPAEQKEIDAWTHGWAVPFFEKTKTFQSMLSDNGFQHTEMKDITQNIVRSAKRLYYAFFPGWVVSKIYNLFHNSTEFSKKNVYTAYYQYTTLKKGLWKYYVVSAEKR